MKPRKSRTIVYRKTTSMLSRQTVPRTVQRRGLTTIVHEVEVVYQLECGHATTRTHARNKPSPEVGIRKLACDVCTAAAKGHRASA